MDQAHFSIQVAAHKQCLILIHFNFFLHHVQSDQFYRFHLRQVLQEHQSPSAVICFYFLFYKYDVCLTYIIGTGFSTTICENNVLIGSSYSCPITNATSTQIVCQIAAGSMLDAKTIQSVQVTHDRQGYLINNGLLQFQFDASISSITPTRGTIL